MPVRWWYSWTTGKRLIGVLSVALILSDSQYKGWQPGKEDLLDIQSGLVCFIDKYGKLSLKEGQWSEDEERGTDSYPPTSFENTPSPQSVPSVERSMSESSSGDPSDWSIGSTEEAAPTRISLHTAAAKEVSQPTPSQPVPMRVTEPSTAAVPATVQPGLFPRGPGGLPQPEGRFFNNPANIRTLVTGSGDGYRSPVPPSRAETLFPLYHMHRERVTPGVRPTNPGFDLSGMAAESTGPSFSAQWADVTQTTNSPGLGTDYGCGPWPPLSSSSVLPAELMAYNDLMMDIGIGQYLGTGVRDLEPPPFIHPSTTTNESGGVNDFGMNGHQWQDTSQHMMRELPQTVSSLGYPQPSGPDHEGGHTSGQQAGASFGGQWPSGGITDYT